MARLGKREVKRTDADVIYLAGPGHGGPALIPSHVSVPTPGSIHEGGKLGYVLVHAFGADGGGRIRR